LFAVFASTTKHAMGKKLWSVSLWVPTAWLAAGAVVFISFDWFGQGLDFSLVEHTWHLVGIALPMLLSATILGAASTVVRNTPGVIASVPSPTWKRLLATGGRVVGWLGLATGSLLAVLASALVLLMFSFVPPS